MSIVLLSSNMTRIGSTGRRRCRLWKRESAWIGALVCKMTLLTIGIALLFSQRQILSGLGPLNTLISSNRGLEIVGVLNHLMLRGRKSLSS
jgi:hypothetical protein